MPVILDFITGNPTSNRYAWTHIIQYINFNLLSMNGFLELNASVHSIAANNTGILKISLKNVLALFKISLQN